MKAIEHSGVCPRGGFTLVELLAVIAVIAIVAGLVIGAAGVAGKKADVARTEAEIGLIQQALDEYRGEYGAYIDMSAPMTNNVFKPLTNYVAEIRFTDPWGQPYRYSCDTDSSAFSYQVISKGPDGILDVVTVNNDDSVQDDISNRK